MRWGVNQILAVAAVLLALVVVLTWPGSDEEVRRKALLPGLEEKLRERSLQISSDDLLNLIHDNKIPLTILDARSEGEFNLFHLLDAERFDLEAPVMEVFRRRPEGAITVIVDNDETRATEALKKLTFLGIHDVYLLEGGLNAWMKRFGTMTEVEAPRMIEGARPGQFAYQLSEALGSRHPWARPSADAIDKNLLTKKVVLKRAARKSGGGCGG
jgi:rhodanese-related sulfurtransferase